MEKQDLMMPMLFTFQIILLVIGLGAGYLFLVKAKTQEDRLKVIGETIGWVVIAATIFLAICNFFYSITILNNYVNKQYCPINSTDTTQQQQAQQDGVPEVPPETENKPIKGDIHDHE